MLSTAATSGNYTTLNTLMAYVTSPQPSSEECDEFLTEAYWNMGSKNSGCQADLNKRSAAVDARLGLGSAGLMRRAAGLRNPDNGKWCYLEAVASTRPDDLYLWSLPAGISYVTFSFPCSRKETNEIVYHPLQNLPARNAPLCFWDNIPPRPVLHLA